MSFAPQNEQQFRLPMNDHSDEYEVITSEEVDRVLDQLESLIASVSSENVKAYLEDAADNIYQLIYGEEELEEQETAGQEDAA